MDRKFKINFRALFFQFTPWFLRKDKLLKYLFSIGRGLQTVNNNGQIVRDFDQTNLSLYPLFKFLNKFVRFDARTIYLEKYLNDYYDPINEGIVIANNNILPVLHIFNTAEESDPVYMFNQWDPAIAYIASPEDYVTRNGRVFVAIANNTNQEPPNISFWGDVEQTKYLFNVADVFPPDFTVQVPIAVSLQPNYSTERIAGHVNLFNAAGTTFAIQIV